MNKKDLIESARQLRQIKDTTSSEYAKKSDLMTGKMNTAMSERKDILELIGEKNMDMMHDNHANHARFMDSMFKHYNPEVFVETILWVFRSYRSHGFTTNYWAAQLNTWIIIMQEILSSEAASEIIPYYTWMQINIPVFVSLSDEKLESEFSRH